MSWVAQNTTYAFPNAHRILVDESLEPEVANTLRRLAGDLTDVVALKANGHWDGNDRGVLLTRNRIFLNDRTLPANRNTTIVILTGEPNEPLLKALMSALSFAERRWELWAGAKVVVSDNGRITVTSHDRDTGARHTFHYKLRLAGPPLVWIPTKPEMIESGDTFEVRFGSRNEVR